MSGKLLAIGDTYLPLSLIEPALAALAADRAIEVRSVTPNERPGISEVHEYQGDPDRIAEWTQGADILLVHAAAVTRTVFEHNPQLRIVACARGNPVNVDLQAARDHGVTVLHTPAKNADSVADLTMVSTHMLFRGMHRAQNWLRRESEAGETHLDSTFVGGQFMAREPAGATIGIIGYGAIGQRVARQAERYGMHVLAYDPYRTEADVELVDLPELLRRSDVVTLHAKASAENRHLIGAEELALLKPGAFVINTARQSLLDEVALLAGLESGAIGGAALDVCEPDGVWPQLALRDDVIITPHLGGATAQTQQRAMAMLVADIQAIESGQSAKFVAA